MAKIDKFVPASTVAFVCKICAKYITCATTCRWVGLEMITNPRVCFSARAVVVEQGEQQEAIMAA